MKRFVLLTLAMLLAAANAWAATSTTGIDLPVQTFQNLIETDVATLVFLGGSVGAAYTWHHDGFGRGFVMVMTSMDMDQAWANVEQVNQSLGEGLLGNGPALMAAVQLNTEVVIHLGQEQEITNELLATDIKMHAFEHAEVLNEKTQAHATAATALEGGISTFVREAAALIP